MRNLIVGTRGSKLALTQTNWVVRQLKAVNAELEIEVKIIKTKGDMILDKALDKIGDKGLFVKEIESELIKGNIDFAVHSMKDMPTENPEGLVFAKIPKREDNRDALVLKKGYKSLDDIPFGGKLGTGSKRRVYQIKSLRPDIECIPVRGNIETRMGKIESENLDGVILAAAGLIRNGHEDKISEYLDPKVFIPAPAQGALGIQYKEKDLEVEKLLNSISHEESTLTTYVEREFLKNVEGSCHLPVGAYCFIENNCVNLKVLFGDEDGEKLVNISGKESIDKYKTLGKSMAIKVLEEM
ncbi:MAG: hydroxymethylbilane synthase [Firmicutes bacterium]|jgi:hydroxymethylbilane synthase|nr:hydroxymethylbilane synthase [Bacillota bacterium]